MALAACAAGPNYKPPVLTTTDSYGVEASANDQPSLVSGMDISAQWWSVFHSADLDALVARALKNNPTIEAADAALLAAREQVKAQRGAYFPMVSASLQPSRQSYAQTLSSPLQSGADIYNLTTTQVSVSYTPDLFGANRRAVESLVAQQDQQRFQLEAARLTLASNVVLAAIADAELREEIQTTQAIIAEQRRTLDSFQRQLSLGQASPADLAQQRALLAQAEAALPPLTKQFRVNRDLLAALLGLTPGQDPQTAFTLQSLSLPEQLPLSLPAQLVQHRPDVRMAEAQLHAASAEIGVAAAARWPNLQIDASAGGAALALTPAFNSAADFWGIAATLTQPIYQGGTLLHRERAAKAAYRQAAAQYRQTVVGAFQNTADTLQALRADGDAFTAAQAAETAAARGLAIARRQLDLGDISRLAVITAEQTDGQARLALVQAQANRYSDVVALFQALGGGWWNRDAASGAALMGKDGP